MRNLVEHWQRDLKQAVRSLTRTPGFAVITTLTLAIAIGANTAMFSVVNTVLINPLPFADSDRLLYVVGVAPGTELNGEFGLFDETFLQVRDRSKLVEDFAFFGSFTSTLRVGDRVERVRMSEPTYTLFSTLGVKPLLGRLPSAEDDSRSVIISHALWRDWFGSDASVVGRTYQVSGSPRAVIAVMGPEFRFPNETTVLWMPRDIRAANVEAGEPGFAAVARIKPGATIEQVTRELTNLTKELPARFGAATGYTRVLDRMRIVARPFVDELLGPAARPLGVLFGAALIVLVIACANVANLFTVRAEGRRREMAVRQAIGAQRGQLLRAQMAEVIVVASAAAVCAVVLARITLPFFVRLAPVDVPRLADAVIEAKTMVFTVVLTALAALACGLVPALRSSAPRTMQMRDGSRGTTSRRRWGRDVLVAAQTGLALVLLIGSGLLLRSHAKLSQVESGYQTNDRFTFQIAPERASLTDGPSFARFSMDFMDRLRGLPGVESVGLIENIPLDEGTATGRFRVDGAATDAGVRVSYTYTDADYYKTMGIRVLAGRGFTREDSISTLGNVVVSRSAAKALWPGGDPIGKRLQRDGLQTWETVVGVVDDVIQENWRREAQPLVYFPLTGQQPRQWRLPSPAYVVKTTRADTIAPDVRALVREVAPEAPMYRAYTMTFLAERQMRDLSFTMLTLGLVSMLALILGAVGLYGALSYVVAERTREIGVRMALGAQPRAVRRMVVGQGVQVVAAGVIAGMVVALVSTSALGRLLFGVEPLDLATFAGMSATMFLIGLLASYLPARRASNVDPIVSLRGE